MSSFERVRGYTPEIAGLPQLELINEIVCAHQEQVASRGLRVLERSSTSNVDSAESSSHDEKVYYFKQGPKFGKWHEAYVHGTGKHVFFFCQLV